MIEINDVRDIEIIRELAKAFSPDINTDKIISAIEENKNLSLKEDYQILAKRVDSLAEIQKQNLVILDKILETLDSFNKEQESKEKQPVSKKTKVRQPDKVFTPYKSGQEEYQLILRNDTQLVHVFTANEKNGTQEHLLPINLFELLIIVESYIKGERSLINSEVNNFCSLFGITRAQFSKIYYNLTIGKFDAILTEVDKMISDSVFTLKKSHIYRNNHDINIDKKEFNELVSIYANDSGNSFLVIYKLIREKNDIDPFDLLITLKKSEYVSKVLGV